MSRDYIVNRRIFICYCLASLRTPERQKLTSHYDGYLGGALRASLEVDGATGQGEGRSTSRHCQGQRARFFVAETTRSMPLIKWNTEKKKSVFDFFSCSVNQKTLRQNKRES